jgi:hypothetical protein
MGLWGDIEESNYRKCLCKEASMKTQKSRVWRAFQRAEHMKVPVGWHAGKDMEAPSPHTLRDAPLLFVFSFTPCVMPFIINQ